MSRCEKCGYPITEDGSCMNGHVKTRNPTPEEILETSHLTSWHVKRRKQLIKVTARTLDSVGQDMGGLTREAIRLIENGALRKMKRKLKKLGVGGMCDLVDNRLIVHPHFTRGMNE